MKHSIPSVSIPNTRISYLLIACLLICTSRLYAQQKLTVDPTKDYQKSLADLVDVPGQPGVKGVQLKAEVGKFGWCTIGLGRTFPSGQYKIEFTVSSRQKESAGVALYTEGKDTQQSQITAIVRGTAGAVSRQETSFYSPIAFSGLAIKKMEDSKAPGTIISSISITDLGRKEYPRLAAYQALMKYAAPWGLYSEAIAKSDKPEQIEPWLDLRSGAGELCCRADYLLRVVRLKKLTLDASAVQKSIAELKTAIAENRQKELPTLISAAEKQVNDLQQAVEKKLDATISPELGTDLFTWLKAWNRFGSIGDWEYSEPTPYRAVYDGVQFVLAQPGERLDLASTWTTNTYTGNRMRVIYSMFFPLTVVDVYQGPFELRMTNHKGFAKDLDRSGKEGWFVLSNSENLILVVINRAPKQVHLSNDKLTIDFGQPAAVGFVRLPATIKKCIADVARFYRGILLNQPVECVQIQKGNQVEQVFEYMRRESDWPIASAAVAPVPQLAMISRDPKSKLHVTFAQPILRTLDGCGYVKNRNTLTYRIPLAHRAHTCGANVWDNNTDPAVYKELTQQGCKTIRLVCGSPGQTPWDWKDSERLKQGVQRNLQWIREAGGLKAGVDMHGWMPSQDFANAEDLKEFVRRWKEIISWCKGYEDVVAWYDLMNEPLLFPYQNHPTKPYVTFMRNAVKALRPCAGKTPFLVEAVNMANASGLNFWEDLGDANIIAGFHDYWPHQFTHQLTVEAGNASYPKVFYPSWMPMMEWTVPSWRNENAGWHYFDRWKCDAVCEPVYRLMIEKGLRMDCGEYGVVGHAGDSAKRSGILWMRHALQRYHRMGINHAVWSPAPGSGFTWLIPELKEETIQFWSAHQNKRN